MRGKALCVCGGGGCCLDWEKGGGHFSEEMGDGRWELAHLGWGDVGWQKPLVVDGERR